MVSTMPNIFKISVRGSCPTRTRTETTMRHHKLVLDEPPQRNGTDLGPTPLETTLAAYLGCTNVIGNILAEEMGIEIKTMSFELLIFDKHSNIRRGVRLVSRRRRRGLCGAGCA